MACQVEFNNSGSISRVNNTNGEESMLFNSLAKLAHINSLEDALEIYKLKYSEDYDNNENIEYISEKGNSYDNYKQALLDSTNGFITIRSGETDLLQISANSSQNTTEGTVNFLIRENILSDERIISEGKSYLQPFGYDLLRQEVSKNYLSNFRDIFKVEKNGLISIKEEEKINNPDSTITSVADFIKKNLSTIKSKSNNLTEDALKSRLLDFLKDIGVTVTTIEKYNKRFNSANTSARALSDIANKIVAFREGNIQLEDLTEETAHFIVEAWNESEIDALIEEVINTDSYKEFADIYRGIYRNENNSVSEQELERLVRKEILGKELAKALQNKFVVANTTPSLWSKMYNLLIDFFNKINLTNRNNYSEDLQAFSDNVLDMLINNNSANYLDASNFANKKFRMYSIEPHSALVTALIEQEQILVRMGRGSSEQVRKLQEYLTNSLNKEQVNDLISLAKRQTNYIRQAVEEANRKNTLLSVEENIVFQNLKSVISPAVALTKVKLEKNKNFKAEVTDLINIQQTINDTIGLLSNNDEIILDELVEDIAFRANRENDEEFKAEYRDGINTAKKDTNSLFSYFGMITQAQDTLLNMLGNVISNIYNKSSQTFVEAMKNFQNKLRELGFVEKDLEKLMQEDGDAYRISKWNFTEFKLFEKYCKAKSYQDNLAEIIQYYESKNETSNVALHKEMLNTLDVATFLDKFEKMGDYLSNITDFDLKQKIITDTQNYKNTGVETFLSEDFMQKQEERIKGFSSETKRILRNFSNLRAQARKQFKKSKNGVNILTYQAKADLDYLASERAKYMSVYDSDGSIIKGLKVYSETEIANIPSEYVKTANNEYIVLEPGASQKAITVYELNKYISDFISNNGTAQIDTLSDKWFKDLEDMETDPEVRREDILDWFNFNTSVGFSSSFFENRENNTFLEDVKNAATAESDEMVLKIIKNYENKLSYRRSLLKQYKDSKNSTNLNVNNMPESTKEQIKSLSIEIENLYSELYLYGRGKGININLDDSSVESASKGANESFLNALRDYNIETDYEIIDFAKKHMTVKNKLRIEEILADVENGVFNKYIQDQTVKGVIEYAKTRMLPYYSTYAPNTLREFYDKVRNSQTPISELVRELEKDSNVRLTPTYEYLDVTSSDENILNKERDPDFKGGTSQPSLIKKPILFGKTFDFNNKNWTKIENNPKLLALHNLVNDFQIKTYELANVPNGNIYLKPQVPKTTMEQALSINKGVAKEWWQSLKNYRVGDIEAGGNQENRDLLSANIKLMPKHYISELENPTNISNNLIYSLALQRQQANLRHYRVEDYAKISAIEEKINSQSRYNGIGLSADSTNTYRMSKSFIDNAIFGIEDIKRYKVSLPLVGEVDATNILKKVHRWKQNVSLARNPIVPLTSYLTAGVNLYGSERWIGQYVDNNSLNRARKTFNESLAEKGNDMLESYSKSKNSVILEHFGLSDLADRYKNSSKGKVGKFLGNSNYILHKMGDFPIKCSIAYTSLHGNRIYKGKVLDYNDFKRLFKDDLSQWNNLPSLYDYVDVKDGLFKYKDELFSQLNMTKEQFYGIEQTMLTKAQALAQRVDGTIRDEERTFAQRNFALRYTQTHKGWLALAAAYRFKGRHFNLQTSQYEEGSYYSAAKMVSKAMEQMLTFNFKKLPEIWLNATQEEKLNIQRVLKEIAVLSGVYLASLAFGGFADDDEDDYSKQLAAYMSDRVVNETNSSNLGVVKEFWSSLTEPIVGIKQITDLARIDKAFQYDTEVSRGRYAGLTETEKYLIKNIVGAKPLYDLWSADNIKSQRNSYNYFNQGNDNWIPITWLYNFEEEEK